ncbi:hypothetical protein P8852_05890 [Bacillus spizizenii]|uniref:Uncharacterized protein n=1 Tax=Bacillus spizizenii TaxID=96241 RepID=A0A9Q4DUA8_BACSC|nr:hypothetical protein JN25_01620 [Bacillus sp. BSC154]MCY7829791.1 hypothetical protein [Bacillus spizizenii]MCY7842559.1 hypothetical protein [Bacillus spizizenii]MCY8123163.1 hypothetical protein [Bacillus spizizenii]MCY8899661.1 hypothetical protein [Bacillus spizizenii]
MVVVKNKIIRKCYKFALDAWEKRSQSQKQFGTGAIRKKNEFIADQLSGKLAECLFKLIVEDQYENVQVQLNFTHYPDPLQTDNGDVSIYVDGELLSSRIDIKGSSHRAQWLLVEEHKFKDLSTGKPLSDCYVMIRFSESMPTSQTLRNNPQQILEVQEISGEITGWANHSDFLSPADNKEWFVFERGQRPWKRQVLPSPFYPNDLKHLKNCIKSSIKKKGFTDNDIYLSVPLDAKINIGLPIYWLRTDLNMLLQPALIVQ